MKLGYLAVIGVFLSVMASTVGLETFSGAWWAFVFATSTLVIVSGRLMASPATP